MPSLSFKGAKNFTITGGNFSEIEGNVFTYNFTQSLGQGNLGEFSPLPRQSKKASSSVGSSRRSERKTQRHRSCLTTTQPPLLLPSLGSIDTSTPAMVSSVPTLKTATPATAIVQGAAPISSMSRDANLEGFEDGNESDNSEDSGYERYSTPPSDMGDLELEHQYGSSFNLPSSSPTSYQPSNPELLTPLADTLNLRRFTPATRSQSLSSAYEVRQVHHAGVQSTYVTHGKDSDSSPVIAPQPRFLGPRNLTVHLPTSTGSAPDPTPAYTPAHCARIYEEQCIRRAPPNRQGGSTGAPRRGPYGGRANGSYRYKQGYECRHATM